MKSKKRITAAEFQALLPFLNISDDRVAAARAAMVEGQTLKSIGETYGWTRQAAGGVVSAVWRVFEKYREAQSLAAKSGILLPPGWEQVTLIAPSHLIAKFRAEIAEASPQVVHKTPGPKPKKT